MLGKISVRHIRILSQTLFLGAFFAAFASLAVTRVPGALASGLLALDPLTGVSTGLADWTLPRWLWVGLVVLALTAVLGRFFCGWICPLGTLQQLVSWIAGPTRRKRAKINRWRPWFATKFAVLTAVLGMAVLGVNHAGWLDPIPLLHRGVAAGLRPLWLGTSFPSGWLSIALLATILILSAWMPRFFCRAVCPTGALLGVFARLAPFRIRRSDASCTGCKLCVIPCQGGDDPLEEHKVSDCHVCLNCIGSCTESSLAYRLPLADEEELSAQPMGLGRRRFLITAAASFAAVPILRAAGSGHGARAHDAIRPPGALDEEAFLARCVTCGACSASCPTGVIVSDLGKTGVDGLFTPIMDMRRGWCEPSCTRCGEVCPSAALIELSPEAKQAIGGPAEVTIGTAFFDRGRCLPWAMDIPCIVCEEMCPTSPKAIVFENVDRITADGERITLQQPHVRPELCTGCGLCENRCPVGEMAAIRVSAVGESRDPDNRMLQQRVAATPPSA